MLPIPATTRWFSSCVFNRTAAAPEARQSTLGVKSSDNGSGPRRASVGSALVAAPPDDRDPPELADVRELEQIAVVEPPPGPHVRDRAPCVRPPTKLDAAGHAEVHDQFAVVVELDQQVLASAADSGRSGSDRLGRRGELGRRVSGRASTTCDPRRAGAS